MTAFDCFFEHANSDKTAIVYDDISLSYKELFVRIQARIKKLSLEKNDNEGHLILIQRSNKLEAITDVLSCLCQGYAFLNIPSDFPAKRVEQIKNISKPYASIDDFDYKKYESYQHYAQDLAYMIFTSGTTGEPKGVMVSNNNLVSFLNALQKVCPCDANTVMLQFASYSFDASIWEVFSTLCFGGTLILTPSKKLLFSRDLADFMNRNQINRALLTPIVARTIIDQEVSCLKDLFVGGDEFSRDILERWKGNCNLWNAYGPTEATVCVALHKFQKGDEICVGQALLNVDLSMQDGELIVKGDQVAIGHITSSDMVLYNGEYHTGDLFSKDTKGNFIFRGRKDDQVKIRGGYRISLQEIQKTIGGIPNAGNVVVLAVANNAEKEMICFFDGQINSQDLKKSMSQILPQYMIPSTVVHIDTWPLNSSGKIDRKSLEKIVVSEHISGTEDFDASRFIHIWNEVLDSKTCGSSNFFELGGQSFQALQVIQSYANNLGITMDLADFFQYPVLNDQIKFLTERRKQYVI